jgi:secondary thiamine-phosphate synthase enzyme
METSAQYIFTLLKRFLDYLNKKFLGYFLNKIIFPFLLISMKEIKVISKKRNEMIDITNNIQNLIDEENLQKGSLFVYVPHTTAGITINEGADPSVQRDIIEALKQLIPENGNYHHSEGNSDAHIKASLIGSSITVLVENNRLVLGTWQHIFFYEGDGPRNRRVYVEIIPH